MGEELVQASPGAWAYKHRHGRLRDRLEGGSPGARLKQANFEQIREEAVNAGFVTNQEIE